MSWTSFLRSIVLRCPGTDPASTMSFCATEGRIEVRTSQFQLTKGDRAFITIKLDRKEDLAIWWKKLDKDLYVGLER